jgi:hypothetical protein
MSRKAKLLLFSVFPLIFFLDVCDISFCFMGPEHNKFKQFEVKILIELSKIMFLLPVKVS